MPLTRQELVRGFQGENRLLPSDLLSDRISPDAQNVDYSSGTLKKRKGFTKLHQSAIISGGVRMENNPANNRCIIIPADSPLDLEEPSTIEFFITFNEDLFATTALPEILIKLDTANTGGWTVRYDFPNARWQISLYDGAGPPANLRTGVLAQVIDVGETYHFAMTRSGTTVTFYSTPLSTNVTVSNTLFANGFTAAADDDLWIGANGDPSLPATTPTNQTVDITIDELRVWDDVRTTAEMDDTRYRELNEEEELDANLVGYWKFNESVGSIANDRSINQNHGTLFTGAAAPNLEPGLVTDSGADSFAARFNGRDEGASVAYRDDFATIQDTAGGWTVEAWLRLDSLVGVAGGERFFAMGDFFADGTNTGCAFSFYVGANGNLFYSYSTTTSNSNEAVDAGVTLVVGQAFHVALVKNPSDTSLILYVTGVFKSTIVDASLAENGPTVDADTGLTVGYMLTAGALGNFCPCTVDELRVWKTPLSANAIATHFRYSGPFNPVIANALEVRLQFDADNVFLDAADINEAITYIPADDKPVWARGFVYPLEPEALQLTAPLTRFLGGADASTGQSLARHEILAATRTDWWLLRGTRATHLDELITPNSADNRYTHTMYRNLLIAVNGLGRNYRYNSRDVPESLTLPQFVGSPTATATGAGSAWPSGGAGVPSTGLFTYRFAWHDHIDDVLSATDGEVSDTVAASTNTVEIASMPSTVPAGFPNVTEIHVYRKDPDSTVFRLVAQVPIGTTTFSDTGFDVDAAEAEELRKGHPNPHKICAVFANRLFLANESANPSSVTYSDANTEDFPVLNTFTVDENDGDEITGMKAWAGGLVIFKQNSIHLLTGSGATSWVLRKLIEGIGCVSHNTIAGSPGGLYFLGEDGVYLFNGQSAVYMSHSQQPEFQKLDRPKARNAVGVYDISTHQYIVSFDQAEESDTLSFYDVEPDLFTHYWKLKDLTDETGTATDLDEVGGAGTGIFHPDSERGITWNGGKLQVTDDSLTAQGSTADVTLGCWVYFVTNDGVHKDVGPFDVLDSAHSTVVMDIKVDTSGPAEVIGPTANITGASLTPAALERKRWYHCVMTKNGNVMRFYLDGELFSQDLATDSTWDATMADLVIGGDVTWGWAGKLQNLFIINDAGLTPNKVKELYDAENTGNRQFSRTTFAYDEETQAWAKWDKGFDTLVLAEHTSSQNDVVAGKKGFVHKILHSDRDGAGFIEGGSIGVSGSLSGDTGPFITDTSNDFPTGGDGLAGVEFVAVPTDTTLSTQKRTILYNTATELQLDTPLHPAVTGTYFIGPIDLHWESRWMDMGDPASVKTFKRMQLFFKENTATLTMKYKSEEVETWKTITFSTSDEFLQKLVETRGRRLKVRFEHIATDETVHIESFQELFDPKDLV